MATTLHRNGISERYVVGAGLDQALIQRALAYLAEKSGLGIEHSLGQPAPYSADGYEDFTVFDQLTKDVVLAKAHVEPEEGAEEPISGVFVFFERDGLGRWTINSSYYTFDEDEPDAMTPLMLARLYVGLYAEEE